MKAPNKLVIHLLLKGVESGKQCHVVFAFGYSIACKQIERSLDKMGVKSIAAINFGATE